ncbi:hypothetical protein BJV74DRAFT_389409 [Russula compacta]|nr:hypothetical protein BJV74DRAFT_389409 [Russula compacta]
MKFRTSRRRLWRTVDAVVVLRSSLHAVDVIHLPQDGNSAAAAIDQSAGHVSSVEGSARTRPQPDDEVLVKPREVAESPRRLAGQARAHSNQRLKADSPPFLKLRLRCLYLQYKRPVRTISIYRQLTVRSVRITDGGRTASIEHFQRHSLRQPGRLSHDCAPHYSI